MHPKDRVQRVSKRLAPTVPKDDRTSKARRLGADCDNCPFALEVEGKKYPNKPVFAAGPHKPIGLLVAEAPGAEEAEEGEPLVGPTGQQLDLELAAVGLSRERLLKVNVIACQPKLGKTIADMHLAAKCCRKVFINQIKHLDRDIPTFGMGKAAALALTGIDQGIMDQRGFVNLDFKLPEE